MAIAMCISLKRRLASEIERHAGSRARLAFYNGLMPAAVELQADGDKIHSEEMPRHFGRAIMGDQEPEMPRDATYWRLLSNEGEPVMQGDGVTS